MTTRWIASRNRIKCVPVCTYASTFLSLPHRIQTQGISSITRSTGSICIRSHPTQHWRITSKRNKYEKGKARQWQRGRVREWTFIILGSILHICSCIYLATFSFCIHRISCRVSLYPRWICWYYHWRRQRQVLALEHLKNKKEKYIAMWTSNVECLEYIE